MTDRAAPSAAGRGRRARWAIAAVLGPPAAFGFAGLTAWAASNPPPPAPVALDPQPAGQVGAEAAAADVQQAVDDTAEQLTEVQRTVAGLRSQARAMRARAGKDATAAAAASKAAAAGPRRVSAPRAVRRVVVRQAAAGTTTRARTSGS